MQAVNTVVYEAISKFLTSHVADKDASTEMRHRHAGHDMCGVFYSVTYAREAGSTDATIAVRTTWPWELCSDLGLKKVLPRLVADGPKGTELSTISSSSAIIAWLLEGVSQISEDMRAVMRWLASIRYLVLSDSLRYSAQAAITDTPLAPAQHAIQAHVSVVSIPLQAGLQVIIPLFSDQPGDEPFVRTIVEAIAEEVAPQQHLPRYTFWESKAPPVDLKPFPAVRRQATLGYVSIQFSPQHLRPDHIERALQSVVFFVDVLQHRLTYCKLLVRSELGVKLKRMQQDLRKSAPTPIVGAL